MVNKRYCNKQYHQYLPMSNNVYFFLINNRNYVSLINIKRDISNSSQYKTSYTSFPFSEVEVKLS